MTYNRLIQGLQGWPASRSTARSWPTSPSTTRPRSPRWSRSPRRRCRGRAAAGGAAARRLSRAARSDGARRVRERTGARRRPRDGVHRADAAGRRRPAAAPPRATGTQPAVPRRGPAGRPEALAPRRAPAPRAVRHRRPRSTGTPTWSTSPARRRAGLRGRPTRPRPRCPRPSPRRASSRSAGCSTSRWRRRWPARRGWSPCSPTIRDPGNAGTVLRTADAAGADAVVLRRRQRRPVQRQVRPGHRRQPLPPAGGPRRRWPTRVRRARAAGLAVLAADGAGERRPRRAAGARRRRPTAWLFGNEAQGLPAGDRRAGRRAGSGSRSRPGPRA